MFCLPITTLIYLWEIYIFPGSVCLFCCRKYVDRSGEYTNRSQTHECGNWAWGRLFWEYLFRIFGIVSFYIGGYRDGTQDSCDVGIENQTLYPSDRSHPRSYYEKKTFVIWQMWHVAFCLRSCLSGARRRKGVVDSRQLVVAVVEGVPTVKEKLWQSAIVSHLQHSSGGIFRRTIYNQLAPLSGVAVLARQST